jgi:hypothetical protein
MGDEDGPEPDDEFERLIYHFGRAYKITLNEDGSIGTERRDDGTVLPLAWSHAEARRGMREDYTARPSAGPDKGVREWLASHPGAEAWLAGPSLWRGSCPLGGSRLTVGPVLENGLLDAMKALGDTAAACLQIEEQRPGWIAWAMPHGRWTGRRDYCGGILVASALSAAELLADIDRREGALPLVIGPLPLVGAL